LQGDEAPAGFFPPDRDGPRPLAASGEGWGPVSAGLIVLQVGFSLIAAGAVVLVLLALGLCIAGVGAMRLDGDPTPAALWAGALVLGLVSLGGLVSLVGQGICCAVPGRSHLKGLILTALVCSLASQALGVVHGIVDATRESPLPVQQGQLLGGRDPLGRGPGRDPAGVLLFVSTAVFAVVGHFLLAGFLRAVGRHFGDLGLAGQADDYMRSLGFFLAVVAGLLAISCVPILGLLAYALPLVVVIGGVILFIKLFNLLAATRSTIATAMAQG
jgi:hypothetical protein